MTKTNKDEEKPYEVNSAGTKCWFQNGKPCKPLTRKQVTKTNKNKYKPYEVDIGGTKRWYKNGELHREDGPAVEYTNGTKHWYQNNLLHRDDGPATEHANGDKCWYQNGELHREDGPAMEYANGVKHWYKNGKLCEPSALKQVTKTNKKKLFRVDAKLSYLVVTEKDIYTVKDFLAWAKNDMHSGELDESSALEIKEVKSTEQIQDYIDRDHDYMTYDTTGGTDTQYVSELIKELGLDSDVIAARLRELGYTVIPPTTKRTVKKPNSKKKTNE